MSLAAVPRDDVEAVREPDEVHASMIEQEDAEADAPLTYTITPSKWGGEGGTQTFTLRRNRPAGAFAVFSARAKSSNVGIQLASFVTLAKAWTIEADHDRLEETLSEVDDLDGFLQGEFVTFVEVATARPSQAP